MRPKCSLVCSQEPATGLILEPCESIHIFTCHVVVIYFNIILQSMPNLSQAISFLQMEL